MVLRTRNRSFKSTSDIFVEVASDKMADRMHGSPENRFRTYTFKDLQQERRKFVKKHEQKKSQNLLKRLLASLNWKNEACEADDEFFTKYYRRNDYPNPDSGYLGVTLSDFEGTSKSCRVLGTRSDRRSSSDRDRLDLVSKRQSTNVTDHRKNRTFLREDLKIANKSVAYAYSRRSRRSSNDLNGCTLKRMFTNCKDNKRMEPQNSITKPDRKRSLKDFLESVIRWMRPDKKKKPRSFVSCDQTNTFYSENVMQMSRSSSVNAILLKDCEEATTTQIGKQNATIRHIYDRKTDKRLAEILAKNKENQDIFLRNRSVENFVKPSAMKDIAKRHSQLPENWRTDGRITARWK